MFVDIHLIKTLVEAATLAPSGDNCQPLRYVWNSPTLEIHDCPERGSAFLNTGNFGTWATVGAAVKNMEIAALTRGVSIECKLREKKTCLAVVQFKKHRVMTSPLVNAISRRTVNRRAYKSEPLPSDIKTELGNSVKGSVRMNFVDRGPGFDALLEAIAVGDSLPIFDHRSHSYFFRWLRWTPEETNATKDGIPVKTLELNMFDSLALRLMRSWRAVRLGDILGSRYLFVAKRKALYRKTGEFGILTVKKWTPQTFFETGRTLQSLWLQATEKGLAFHAMMGLPVLAHINESDARAFSGHQKVKLTRVVECLKKTIPFLRDRTLAFVFRIGEAPAPSARALRRSVDDVLEIRS